MEQSPFYHYNSVFDAQQLIHKYARPHVTAHPSYATNFIGLKLKGDYMPECVRHNVGSVEPAPIPANWHADIAEFGAVLRAIDIHQGGEFVMGELGCGWGCWIGIAGLAAKARGLTVKLFGVEGDAKHVNWAEESMLANGFSRREFTIVKAVASQQEGHALFPVSIAGTVHYGLEPIFNASEIRVKQATREGTHRVIPMQSLAKIFRSEERIDLLHIDIQGSESDLVERSLQFLTESVAYLAIGTHSRVIEGKLIQLLGSSSAWSLEIERPAIFSIGEQGALCTVVDGVQGWRNQRLN